MEDVSGKKVTVGMEIPFKVKGIDYGSGKISMFLSDYYEDDTMRDTCIKVFNKLRDELSVDWETKMTELMAQVSDKVKDNKGNDNTAQIQIEANKKYEELLSKAKSEILRLRVLLKQNNIVY